MSDLDQLNLRLPTAVRHWFDEEGARQSVPVSGPALARHVLEQYAREHGFVVKASEQTRTA